MSCSASLILIYRVVQEKLSILGNCEAQDEDIYMLLFNLAKFKFLALKSSNKLSIKEYFHRLNIITTQNILRQRYYIYSYRYS